MAVEVAGAGAGRRKASPVVAAVSGGVFVLALLVGFFLAPAAPSPWSARLRVHEFFVAHHDATLNQSFFVHGVAGVALAVLVVALWRMFANVEGRVARPLLLVAGLGAALASFVQLDVVMRIEHHIENEVGTRQTDRLFDALNRAGASKLVLLAVAIGATSLLIARSTVLPRWLAGVGCAAVPVLVLAAVGLAEGPSVPAALSVWVPALVVWTAATGVLTMRGALASRSRFTPSA
jgi:hypothetical protein